MRVQLAQPAFPAGPAQAPGGLERGPRPGLHRPGAGVEPVVVMGQQLVHAAVHAGAGRPVGRQHPGLRQ